jgi:hypothetical protein
MFFGAFVGGVAEKTMFSLRSQSSDSYEFKMYLLLLGICFWSEGR